MQQMVVTCNKNKEVGYLRCMRRLVNVPASSELCCTYLTISRQRRIRNSSKSNEHVSNLVCLLCRKVFYRVNAVLLLVSASEIYSLSTDTLVHLCIRSCRRLASISLHRHNTTHLMYFVWMMEP